VSSTGDTQPSGIEFLSKYFAHRHGEASLLEVRREVCVSMMLGRVGLALECPDELLDTVDEFNIAKADYTAAYREYGAAILKPVILSAAGHGPVTILRAASYTVEKIQDNEVRARQSIYELHDLSADRLSSPGSTDRTVYDKGRDMLRWRQMLKRHRGITANPYGLVTLAERYLVNATLALLEAEELQLRTRERLKKKPSVTEQSKAYRAEESAGIDPELQA
jgi:hypothetical protein